jgi:hypothetical protein
MLLAESEDRKNIPDGMDVPQEIARRQTRRKRKERTKERYAVEQAAYEVKMAERERKRAAGKKPRGDDPDPPANGPQEEDQINLTEEESRIMQVSGGFDQCYNAQAAVDTDSMLMVGNYITQACTSLRAPGRQTGSV